MNELANTTNGAQLVNVGYGTLCAVEPKGKNYIISCPFSGLSDKLVRDVDFGLIPHTSTPSLFKSGAEKICMIYGVMQRFTSESEIEQYDGKTGFFFYRMKCELVKGFFDKNGEYKECVMASGYGSSNTGEKRNGFNSAFDSANATLKMSEKRALVAASLHLSGLSSMFTQDIEDTKTMDKAKLIIDENPSAVITSAQIKRLFAIAANEGLTTEECKDKLAAMGYASSKDIKQGQYNEVINAIKELGNK